MPRQKQPTLSQSGSGNILAGGNLTIHGDLVTGDKTESYNYYFNQPLELSGARLPHARNPLFVGRDETLAQLAQRLNADLALVILTAPGGLGKSQTAVEFAYRCAAQFPGGVFWLNFAQPNLISSEVAACGSEGRLPLPNFDALPRPERVALVQREWAKLLPRLLVFDNAEDPDLVKLWRPVTGGCRVLVTARRADWPATLTPHVIALPALARAESLKLLAQGDAARAPAFAADPAANAIAEQLGDLPLALHCAGAYLAHYDLAPAPYLAELHAQSALEHESLKDWLSDREALPTAHTPNVAATFELSYRKLTTPLPAGEGAVVMENLALHLFHLLAHCAPATPLPREVLLKAAEITDAKLLADALETLTQAGLIALDSEHRPLVHRLVQDFARARAPDAPANAAQMETAVGALAQELLPTGHPRELEALAPHLRTLIERSPEKESVRIGQLYDALGSHAAQFADYAAAREAHGRALTIYRQALGAEHCETAMVVNNLGLVFMSQGDLLAARGAFQQALAIDEKTLPPDDPRLGRDLNNLGLALKDLKELGAARSALERALAIRENAFGPDDPKVAVTANNLGLVLYESGQPDLARQHFERALAIDEKSLPPDHPHIAIRHTNLGLVYFVSGELGEARLAFEHALAINENAFGPDHPSAAGNLNNLGLVSAAAGNMPAARDYYQRALAIMERHAPNHPDTEKIRANLKAASGWQAQIFAMTYKGLAGVRKAAGGLVGGRDYARRVKAGESPDIPKLIGAADVIRRLRK